MALSYADVPAADVIFANDDFTIDKGEVTKHVVDYRKAGDRGDALVVYSLVKYKDGTEDYDIMTIADCEAIKKRSKAGSNGPWVTDYLEMCKKTVMRRHAKRLPQSPELQHALDRDLDAPDFAATANVPDGDTIKAIETDSKEVTENTPEQEPAAGNTPGFDAPETTKEEK